MEKVGQAQPMIFDVWRGRRASEGPVQWKAVEVRLVRVKVMLITQNDCPETRDLAVRQRRQMGITGGKLMMRMGQQKAGCGGAADKCRRERSMCGNQQSAALL